MRMLIKQAFLMGNYVNVVGKAHLKEEVSLVENKELELFEGKVGFGLKGG